MRFDLNMVTIQQSEMEKLHKFTSNETLKYILETKSRFGGNPASIFRIHMVSHMYWRSKFKLN